MFSRIVRISKSPSSRLVVKGVRNLSSKSNKKVSPVQKNTSNAQKVSIGFELPAL
ncbi:uncharacterized protein [Blastocystis hominis]|uniref:Uncharacterized protein n=1 Tax=Blastocystis hominis TaxID=12968 RepID=D8LYB3_BLAHO|nr:uncharacterized protein [Blastocystis hominis]CBK20568.2 unnamed protein product [Blastocystis hominis]|eukprot:XP_012894616.1 uncharacterized protein [Blastocystis hominis]